MQRASWGGAGGGGNGGGGGNSRAWLQSTRVTPPSVTVGQWGAGMIDLHDKIELESDLSFGDIGCLVNEWDQLGGP